MIPNSVLEQSKSVCNLSTISETSHCQTDSKCLCPHSLKKRKTINRTSSDKQLDQSGSKKLSRSNSLNSLDSLKSSDQKNFLTKMIQNQNLPMKVLPELEDHRIILIGSVGDQVIYLSLPQINLFDYLITQGILQHLKNNWESIQNLYSSRKV